MLLEQQVLIADSQVVVAIHTFLPAVDLGQRAIHNVLGANDGASGQENTAKKALERKSKNREVPFTSTLLFSYGLRFVDCFSNIFSRQSIYSRCFWN